VLSSTAAAAAAAAVAACVPAAVAVAVAEEGGELHERVRVRGARFSSASSSCLLSPFDSPDGGVYDMCVDDDEDEE